MKEALITSVSAVRKMTGLALHARTAQQYLLVHKGDLLTAYAYSITKGQKLITAQCMCFPHVGLCSRNLQYVSAFFVPRIFMVVVTIA